MLRTVAALSLAALQLTPNALPLPTENQFFDVLGSYIESLRAQAAIPGLSAAVVGPNGILWERGFGRQDVEHAIAARPDTPYQLDGLTQVFTAVLVLRCVEEGRFALSDRISQFDPSSPDANATIGELLTHTDPGGLTFSYRPERLAPLAAALRRCTGPFRSTMAGLLDRLAMRDSVPGGDAVTSPDDGATAAGLDRYTADLGRLATPYAIDRSGHASPSRYTATTLTPSSGLIASVNDYAQFDLALKQGVLLQPQTLDAAWHPPITRAGQPALPHGMGWFVQTYKNERIVWQFGVSSGASSSLAITLPSTGVTLIMAANSDGLVNPFPLAAGDLTVSPFGQLFLGAFIR
jgi:CubicO group peptidase (beta-lactamase class C family)